MEASRVDFAKSKFHALPLAISISGGGINEVSDGVCNIRDACSNREVIETLWQALLSRTASASGPLALQATALCIALEPALAARRANEACRYPRRHRCGRRSLRIALPALKRRRRTRERQIES